MKNQIEFMKNQILSYDEQLSFKKFIVDNFGIDQFSFDSVYAYDFISYKDIDGLVADGSLNWYEAYIILKNHFDNLKKLKKVS